MDVFGSRWEGYIPKIKDNWMNTVTDFDTVLIPGDISWATYIDKAEEDFRFISDLPGTKLLSRGNHDFWWTTAAKTKRFFAEHGIETIDVLNNNFFTYGDFALCGTRGWFYEEETGGEHDKKIMRREIMRLETSLKAAGDREKLVFLHYPPLYQNYRCEEILALLKEHNVRLCCYGHIHGKGCRSAFTGWHDGTEYKLVSADAVNFSPVKLL